MSDIEIECQDCQTPFMYTDQDQAFYAEKGFTPPKRCKACRQIRKDKAAGGGSGEHRAYGGGRGGSGRGDRELHDAVCSDCGDSTQVPFKPSGDRPILCGKCFKGKRTGSGSRR